MKKNSSESNADIKSIKDARIIFRRHTLERRIYVQYGR